MKKLVISCLLVIMTLSLTACGSKNNSTSNSTKQEAQLNDAKGSFGDLKTMPEFKVNDVNDKVVTNDIFKDKKLTMINIWGTFCKPCIDEMPELQELYKEYEKKGVNIIGIVADGDTNEVKAFEILKKSKVDFTNLIPNEKFQKDFVSKTNAVPVTIFLNSKGEILETVVGAREKEAYKKLIENNLNMVK